MVYNCVLFVLYQISCTIEFGYYRDCSGYYHDSLGMRKLRKKFRGGGGVRGISGDFIM